ncbi:MAG: GNAT family N-acetyltransferase [Frankiales bacterium]|nr:GNAT family N-acetyltransferase [Frankiales bacterium]
MPSDQPCVELLAFGTPDHDDGIIVDLPLDTPLPGEPLITVCLEADGGRVLEVHVGPIVSPGVPPLWYVEQPQPSARPAAMLLIAFATDHRPEGSVVDEATFKQMDVHSNEQVGAVRWYPDTGLVHQLYVSPRWRRRGIGTMLVAAAGAYRAARGWAPIWSDNTRTDLAEEHMRSLPDPFKDRYQPRTSVMAPPSDDPAG